MAMEPKPVRFTEAIDFLRRRLALPDGEWERLQEEAGAAGVQRATGLKAQIARDFLEALTETLDEGGTLDDFREDYDAIVARRGWEPPGGADWHSELVFRTLTAQSYAAGRWQQIERLKAVRPYLRYVTMEDNRVRPAHAAWHNTILPVDHPWWDTHYPPCGFNCRCHVQSLSERDLSRYGLTISAEPPADAMVPKVIRAPDGTRRLVLSPVGIDLGFGVNVGKVGLMLPKAD
ncbi:MAG: hypothetical protein BGN87_06290 [Rhizobiales bacterium 65-79]|jgi:SPP1 gp7 family putative phage head morphogenesis protein|nr:minor capsid protein [Hyphomicrobiales bacterium]OJU02799.1 MAG: hypothetical protein BGN87_06290 [Rhizobiales bacterium 65-79]